MYLFGYPAVYIYNVWFYAAMQTVAYPYDNAPLTALSGYFLHPSL